MKLLTIKKNVLVIITFFLIIFITSRLNIRCPWINSLNIYCAGCGGTRMFISLINMDFYQAFRYNPLLFVTAILFLIYIISVFICKILKIKVLLFNKNHLITYLIISLLFMILRNTSTFSFLKPTIIK